MAKLSGKNFTEQTILNDVYDTTNRCLKTSISADVINQNIEGDVAHDAADSGNPVKIGGKASAAKPTAVTANDRVNAYFDVYGRQHVYDEGGGGVGGGGYMTYIFDATNSYGHGSVVYTAATQVTVSGLSFTPSASGLVKIEEYDASGVFVSSFTPQQNTITYAAGVYTIAAVTLGATSTFVVYQQGPERTSNLATNSQATSEGSPMNYQPIEFSFSDGTNVAASQQYYPSALGQAMLGQKTLTGTVKYIDGDAVATLFKVQICNDEDPTNGLWLDAPFCINGTTGTLTGTMGGVSISVVNGVWADSVTTSAAQTSGFAFALHDCAFRFIRLAVLPGDATNTLEAKGRLTTL
ncbi:hypothetical protein M0R04_12275 [Candidatus Dojkabacteria bacterium]|jgi:hypothetical protein|nr:hypothetical protein [Candidatus Dojkabacteria bacterium]